MKRELLLACGILLTSVLAFGQSSDRKFSIGLNTGISDFHGEVNQQWFNKGAYRGQVGLNGLYYLNPWLNVGLDASYGKLGYHVPDSGGVRANVFQMHGQLRVKFNNGKWLKEDARFQPYVFIGTGLANFAVDGDDELIVPGTDWTGNAGLGFNVMANEWLGFNYNLNYAMTNSDDRDGRSSLENDQFMIHSVGVLFHIGKKADADNDGVSDKKDKCPSTPAGVKVDVYGCAIDTDKDGIADHLDACPDMAGTVATKGCPDADNDGIVDTEDACPSIAGIASAKGCPDADGDGIKDTEDACPTVKGLVAMKGCPDTDGDGIADNVDTCPTIAGVASNNGCPEIKQETKDVFEQALKGIQFQSGKDIIKTSSYGILNNVAGIMKTNPSYKLEINGHTDSSGDDAKNMILSKKRAEAVKKYLISKGVEESRLTAKGFGETLPKATNDTSAGRAENRRVEFKVKF